MDDKSRFILAIVLCVGIFFIFSPPPKKPSPGTGGEGPGKSEQTTGGDRDVPVVPTGDAGDPSVSIPDAQFERNDSLVLSSSKVQLIMTTEGASVSEVILTDYHENDFETKLVLMSEALEGGRALTLHLSGSGVPPLDRVDWQVVKLDATEVVFRYPLGGTDEIRKTIAVSEDDPYLLRVEVEVVGADRDYALFGPRKLRFDHDSRQINHAVAGLGGAEFESVEREEVALVPRGRLEDPRTNVRWAGLESNYFAFVIRPVDLPGTQRIVLGSYDELVSDGAGAKNKVGIQGIPFKVGFAAKGTAASKQTFEVFLGPKDPTLLAAYEDRGYPELVYYGDYLGGLVRLFLMLLRFFEGFIGSWGIAIVCLTFVVKLLLHPINKRNQGMMQRQSIKMKDLQPKMDKIKAQHKNDPARATREIQVLMKDENVNPIALFGGCLLIFLQLPIWIGLISTFTLAIELRHQPFLYISDLTQADHLFGFGFSIPVLGPYFNLLPILYVILTLVNQKMMPKSADPQMQSQQKMMTIMMVAFGFIFYSFSSGLLVYFITSAALGIVEQRIIRAELKREGVIPA